MSDRLIFLLALFSVTGSGLIAGLFFAFSSFIMTALARIPNEQGINAMQSINATILNPTFGALFTGTALTSIVLAVLSLMRWGEPGSLYLLTASLLYLAGFLVTMAFNVPLNDALAAFDPGSSAGGEVWNNYLKRWLPWNHVRTITSLGAMILFVFALRHLN
ncbi:DUF1772 domain-containing protein [Virgibacillus sp. LDC1]|uniref:anthrone oxygenase family protein n=1 Tax=Paenibacillus lautus TaxID=1401 RepID=UPI002DBB6E74|nr:anthrone oxygenase family protein [Paenibacillus lautus]MCV4232731.1 DUF1772 domain-containing protein [Virgibacillus sp. LDC1]MEC0308742.1 DUF1772 domain-containing protein [Paenibacillus lautus]